MPTAGPRTLRNLLTAAALTGLAGLACRDATNPPAGDTAQAPAPHLAGDQAVRMTGGGRIDAPPGTAQKNPPKSKIFQTFGFNVGDQDGDGLPEGDLEFVDHTPANRIGGRPLNLKAIAWHTYARVADDCADAAIQATGTLRVKNTGEQLEFRLHACDNGEPGTKAPHDRFELDVFDESGDVRWSWHGLLTGGNLQAHFDEPPQPVPTTGDLEVRASTTGEDLDPDGYTVRVDGAQSQTVGTNGSVTFAQVVAGDHEVLLDEVAGNCAVSGPNPRTVTVPAGGMGSTTFDVSCTGAPPPGTGDLTITTSTTGDEIPEGYTLDVSGPGGTATQPIGANASVTFSGITSGDYTVSLSDVPANCTVGGLNPRTVTVPAGGTGSTTFEVTCEGAPPPPPPPPPPGGVRITGLGTIGQGSASPGSDRQEFDFDVASDLTGRFFYRDWSVTRGDGTVATVTVDPAADPATGIRRFRDGSNACPDFTRGAEFDATGRVDTGDLLGFTVVACDNGTPGTGVDFFRIEAPFLGTPYSRAGLLTSGDIVKSGGGTPRPMGVRVTGLGQLGVGLPLPGNDVQTFQFDISSDLAGSKFYTDWGIIRPDGTVGTLRVDPADLGTRITAFRDGSLACPEFARGVEFEGIGRVNSGGDTNPGASELLPFTARTCDSATPGTGADFLELVLFFGNFTVRYQKARLLTAGDIVKSRM